MKKINVLGETNIVYLYLNGYLTIFKNKLQFYDYSNSLRFEKTLPGNSSSSTTIINQILFVEYFDEKTKFENTFIMDIKSANYIFENLNGYMIRSYSLQNNMAIALKYDSVFNETTAMLNLEKGNILWEKKIENLPFFITDKLLISAQNSRIKKVNINGIEEWTYNTTQLGTWTEYDGRTEQTEVRRILGVLDEKLYIYLNSGKVLVLDINTGEKKLLISNQCPNSINGSFGFTIELDKNNKQLIQLGGENLFVHDLKINKTSCTIINDMVKSKLNNYELIVFDDEYIYFSDRYECKLATLNRKTMRIDWIHSLSDTVGCEMGGSRHGRHLKLHNGRLYVVDNKHTLHIFEREALL